MNDNNIDLNDYIIHVGELHDSFRTVLEEAGFLKWTRPNVEYGYRYAVQQGAYLIFYNFMPHGITRNIYIVQDVFRFNIKFISKCSHKDVISMTTKEEVIKDLMSFEDEISRYTKLYIDWDDVRNILNHTEETIDSVGITDDFDIESLVSKYEW